MADLPLNQIVCGSCLDVMRAWPDSSIQCCVTSPPYWGLRDYGVQGQLGLERTPEEYVAKMVEVFREVRRVLRDDGTLWLNLGDTYNAAGRDSHGTRIGFKQGTNRASQSGTDHYRPSANALKPKDLVGIPWRVAFGLQADGWYLRQDIIWHKPNPMPESVTDRCTKAHEYIFLLTKSERYCYDTEAISEPAVGQNDHDLTGQSYYAPGQSPQTGSRGRTGKSAFRGQRHARSCPTGPANRIDRIMRDIGSGPTRNRRSVWTVTTTPFKGAHFATFPPKLIEPCIRAGTKPGDVVLDPFGGAGTTGLVADREGRNWVLIELKPDYCRIARERLKADVPLLAGLG